MYTELTDIYPNPVDSLLNLESILFEYVTLSIVDAAGREHYVANKTGNSIDVSMLPSGLYVLRLSNDTESITKKFLKK
jgi:hypothetical protein